MHDAKGTMPRIAMLLEEVRELLTPARSAKPANLTKRQCEFLRLVSHTENWPYRYIAVLLGVELCSVHDMRRRLFGKLHVHSRLEMVRKVESWRLE